MNSHLTMIVVGNELVFVLIIDFLNSDFTGFRSHIVLLIQREGDERKVIFQESGGVGEEEDVRDALMTKISLNEDIYFTTIKVFLFTSKCKIVLLPYKI